MLLLLTTYLLTLPALFVILFLGVLFSMGDMDGWAIIAGIASTTIAFFMFDLTILQVAIGAVIYFIAGVVWSFWRYKRYSENIIDIYNIEPECEFNQPYRRDKLIESLKIENMAGRITSWILSWPFSMIENIIGDVIRLVRNLVTDTLKSVYNNILESATKNIKPLKETK